MRGHSMVASDWAACSGVERTEKAASSRRPKASAWDWSRGPTVIGTPMV